MPEFLIASALIGFLIAAFIISRRENNPAVTLLLAFQTGGLAGALIGVILFGIVSIVNLVLR